MEYRHPSMPGAKAPLPITGLPLMLGSFIPNSPNPGHHQEHGLPLLTGLPHKLGSFITWTLVTKNIESDLGPPFPKIIGLLVN